MRQAAILLLASLSLLIALPIAASQGNGSSATTVDTTAPLAWDIYMTGHVEGSKFVFKVAGLDGVNPTIPVAPGAVVTLHLKTITGGVHNVCVEPSECSEYANEGGSEVTLTFTAPQEGTIAYWCLPHKSSGMTGTIEVVAGATPPVAGAGTGTGTGAGAGTGTGAGEGTGAGAGAGAGAPQETFTGETADLADLGYPECAGTKIPIASAEKAVGGPTISDYVDRCHAGGASVSTARPAHGADYVIPASFGILALGIAGIAWAHRAYRP